MYYQMYRYMYIEYRLCITLQAQSGQPRQNFVHCIIVSSSSSNSYLLIVERNVRIPGCLAVIGSLS